MAPAPHTRDFRSTYSRLLVERRSLRYALLRKAPVEMTGYSLVLQSGVPRATRIALQIVTILPMA